VVVRVGVREFRENLRAYLDRIEAGDEVVITDRGKPIARMTEPETHEALRARLIREGRVTPAKKPWGPIDRDKLPTLPPGPSLSDIVIAMRRGAEF
jgi:prevent-host-death family protein